MNNSSISLLLFIFAFFSCTNNSQQRASLAVINAHIWTGDSSHPWAEAMAISGDTLLYVGDAATCKKLIDDSTDVVDAGGQMVVPGFNDSHVHMIDGGYSLLAVQLRDVTNKADFISRIGAYAKTLPHGVWITGGLWNHQNWGGELPTSSWIDSVTPNNPVWLSRIDGHMGLANSEAMKRAGINGQTKAIAGGEISRNDKGEFTGILKDNAMAAITTKIESPPASIKDKAMEAAMKLYASCGITSMQNLGYDWAEQEVFQRAHDQGKLTLRIYSNMPLSDWKKLSDLVKNKGRGDKWLRIGGLKGYVDGSLGAHTAAMLEPFIDKPGDNGLLITPLDSLYTFIQNADASGLQVMVHAIGDRAIRTQLEIFDSVAKVNGPRDRRFRIEHLQHIHPDDIKRVADLKVIASMQPYHAIDDGCWAEKYIGLNRSKTTYAFKSLLDAGATLAFGSDWFVAPPSPLEGIYAAVTRRTLDGKNPGGWIPEQKITVEQALIAYTMGGAYAAFDEKIKGSLEKGKLADFVILQEDLFKVAPEKIKDVKVVATYTGGKKVYGQ